MNVDEALRELGVAKDAGHDAVRRAYLRLLKTRKPDVDPEGFKRLREAYDVATAMPAWVAIPEVSDVPASAPATVTPPAPEASSKPAARSRVATPSVDLTTDLSPIAEISSLVQLNELLAAGDRMRARFDDARTRDGVVLPPLAWVIGVVLRLYEAREVAPAIALYTSAAQWIAMTHAEVRVVGALALPWAFTGELLTLPPSIDLRLRLTLARAIREGRPGMARDRVEEIHIISRKEGFELACFMRAHTPLLAQALAKALMSPPPNPSKITAGVRLAIVGAMALVAVLKMVLPDGPPSRGESQAMHAPASPRSARLASAAADAHALESAARAEGRDLTAQHAKAVAIALSAGDCERAIAWARDVRASLRNGNAPSETIATCMATLERSLAPACVDGGAP